MAADDLWLLGKYLKDFVPEPVTASQAKARKKEPKRGFYVYDDEWADDVAVMQEDRRHVEMFTGRGYRLKRPFGMTKEIAENPKLGPETARLIAAIVRDNLASHWRSLKAVDLILGEFAEELGEDPLRPQLRELLDDALGRIKATTEQLREYIGPWELPDDPGEALALTRKLVERVLR